MHKGLVHAMMKIYICQLTNQLILVQNINKWHQNAFEAPRVLSTSVKVHSIFSRQLLYSYLEGN